MKKEKIIDKLLKIKSLAEKGYKGEAEQAKKLLLKLLSKYGLTISDLESETKSTFYVSYSSKAEETILAQIVYSFNLGCFEVKQKGRKIRELSFECSNLEYAEILEIYAFHRKLFKEEMELFIEAYVHKHRLFRPTKERIGDEQELTRDEKHKVWRIANMMNGISNKEYKKKGLMLDS